MLRHGIIKNATAQLSRDGLSINDGVSFKYAHLGDCLIGNRKSALDFGGVDSPEPNFIHDFNKSWRSYAGVADKDNNSLKIFGNLVDCSVNLYVVWNITFINLMDQCELFISINKIGFVEVDEVCGGTVFRKNRAVAQQILWSDSTLLMIAIVSFWKHLPIFVYWEMLFWIWCCEFGWRNNSFDGFYEIKLKLIRSFFA